MNRAAQRSCAALAALWIGSANAGSLSVGPTMVELSAAKRVASLRVQNTGSEKTIVQLDTVSWAQDGGEEIYTPTQDLLATPAVFQLAPGESREIRVGLRNAAPIEHERSYRLYVREVVPTRSDSVAELSFALRIGVPIFAIAPRKDAKASIEGSTQLDAESCQTIRVRNTGDTRLRATKLEVVSNGAVAWQSTTPFYILAGAEKPFKPEPCLRRSTESPTIRLHTEAGEIVTPAPLH